MAAEPAFDFVVAKASLLKRLIMATKDLVSDANFLITGDGLSMRSMDVSHVALVSLALSPNAFSEFFCRIPQTIGMNLVQLKRILDLARPEDSVSVSYGEDDDKLPFRFRNEEEKKDTEVELNVLTIESVTLTIPETEYPVTLCVRSSQLKKLVGDLSIFGSDVLIAVSQTRASFSTRGDGATPRVEYTHGEKEGQMRITCIEPTSACFSLSHLATFTKEIVSDEVSIKFGRDIPLCMTFPLDANKTPCGSLKFYLASKAEDD